MAPGARVLRAPSSPPLLSLRAHRPPSRTQSFWRYFNSIEELTRDTDNLNVQLFRDGIQPLWEAPENANGGQGHTQTIIFIKIHVSLFEKN